MPPPDVKKGPQMPQDEPAKAPTPNPPPAPLKPAGGPPEPVKDDDGKPVVKAVSVAETSIPHEEDDEAPEPRIDETVPGGRYQVGDKIVNCDGEVLGDAPKSKKK